MCLFATFHVDSAESSSSEDIFDLSLEELLSVTVVSASGKEEPLRNASATMSIITAQDIKERAYTDLSEVLADLPGFDNMKSYGHERVVSYQRGYRTPSNQRTLFMVNGIILNSLWSQEFSLNRQFPMTNIKQIEVLYGPAGAIYGPNAYSGVVNIITNDSKELSKGDSKLDYNIQLDSFATTAIDLTARGKENAFSYSISAKWLESDGPELNDFPTWGFLRQEYLSDTAIWGPVLQRTRFGKPYGEYSSPDDEKSLIGNINVGNLTLGLNYLHVTNGYGLKFSLDKGQPNAAWSKRNVQWYLRYEKQLNSQLSSKTFLRYQKDRRSGDWAEATADWNAGYEGFSYVSISDWNVLSQAFKFRQDWEYQPNDDLNILAGLKYESKELTKAFDVCGYWSSGFCSSSNGENLGPEGQGEGVYHSTFLGDMPIIPGTLSEMPAHNIDSTNDKGAYIQASFNVDKWRHSGTLRWDRNSKYGSYIKPRIATSYDVTNTNTVKLIYSTAFQEPAPILVYGGWNGRRANLDLRPEEITNLEFVWQYQSKSWLNEISIYSVRYEDVIKEEAQNAGERETKGFEYRGQYNFSNIFEGEADIKAYLNYTYSSVKSNITYDHTLNQWVGSGIDQCSNNQITVDDGIDDNVCRSINEDLGDIAPHKVNLGVNIPFNSRFNFNVRANFVSERELYLRNPLRDQGVTISDYLVLNANMGIKYEYFTINLKVNNLLNEEYFHPGIVAANSGDVSYDAQGNLARYANGNLVRSQGFNSSLLPQVERKFSVIISSSF